MTYFKLSRYGKLQKEKSTLRGEEFQDVRQVSKQVKKGKLSGIKIANLPMPEHFETRHMLIHGTTGSGKSVCIRELLDQTGENLAESFVDQLEIVKS